MALEGTLAVSSTASFARLRISANGTDDKSTAENKTKGREREREKEREVSREMRKISSVVQCDSLQTRSRSFSLSLSVLGRARRHTRCSRAVCQSKIVSAIKLNFLHPLPSTRWERGVRRVAEEKISWDFTRSRCVCENDRKVTPTLRKRSLSPGIIFKRAIIFFSQMSLEIIPKCRY